jgi:allophanate hydrolase
VHGDLPGHAVRHRAETAALHAALTPFVVYGTFMRGQPGHANLEGGTFVDEVLTAPQFRLYYVDGRWPALIRDDRGARIACELYALSEEHLARLAELEPREWRRAPVELDDGRLAEAFLGDPELRRRGVDITAHGGWAAFTTK